MDKKPIKKIPRKKPKEFWLGYRELLPKRLSWGLSFDKKSEMIKEQKNPTDSTLQFAFLTKIVDLLIEISNEEKRNRKIT